MFERQDCDLLLVYDIYVEYCVQATPSFDCEFRCLNISAQSPTPDLTTYSYETSAELESTETTRQSGQPTNSPPEGEKLP